MDYNVEARLAPDLVLVIGNMGGGKTTAARMIAEVYGYSFHSLGNGIRKCFSEVFEKKLGRKLNKAKDRKLLQYLGDFVRGKLDAQFEIDYAKENNISDMVFAVDLTLWYDYYCIQFGYDDYQKTNFETHDFWIRLEQSHDDYFHEDVGVIIDDMRYFNERDSFQIKFENDRKLIILRIETNQFKCAERLVARDGVFLPESWKHQSEIEHPLMVADVTITNNGSIQDLQDKIDELGWY